MIVITKIYLYEYFCCCRFDKTQEKGTYNDIEEEIESSIPPKQQHKIYKLSDLMTPFVNSDRKTGYDWQWR